MAALILEDFGAVFFALLLADFAVFGSAGAAAGSADLGGVAFADSLSCAVSAFWRASAKANLASRKARI